MKRSTIPITHSLLKLPTSPTASGKDVSTHPSMYSLVSYFLSSRFKFNHTRTLPRFLPYHTQILPSSSLHPLKNEFIPTGFLDSCKPPKPVNKIVSFDQNLSSAAKNSEAQNGCNGTKIPSGVHPENEFFATPSLNSFNKVKPTSQVICIGPQIRNFSQRRSAPFSKSMDSGSSDSIPVNSTMNSPFESSAPIDAGHSMRKPISLWPGMYHSPVTNALWEARSTIFERLSNVPADAPSPNELISKPPSKSRTSIVYKFSTDYILREQYRNPWNEIRMGKLVEDLDALAGTISFKHCCNNDSSTRPLLLVTASVDKIVLKKPIPVDNDLTITGAVTWVGRSSLEIQLEVTQSTQEMSQFLADTHNASDGLALTANFTFVARDSKTGKSAPVNQISPETERERLLWKEAEERNQLRKKMKGEKNKGIENDEEVNRLSDLLAEGRIFSDMPALADRDSILIRDTCLQNSLVCQPQQRNIHGRIFGGFLMRRAFELAHATAYTFAGTAPCFLEVDHVDFLKPVDVGNFLRFKSCVLYTELENPDQPLINVEVVAHVTCPEHRSSEVSNKFYFTFSVRPDALRSGLKIRNVVPATEEEARRVIERMDAEKM